MRSITVLLLALFAMLPLNSLRAASERIVKVAFMLEHFLVRGTEVATFDYADYNEKVLNNASYIIFLNDRIVQENFRYDHSSEVELKFKSRFPRFFECKTIEEVNHILALNGIDIVYWQGSGSKDLRYNQLACRTAIHAVFDFVPQGDAFAAISHWLSASNARYKHTPVVPYIVHPPADSVHTLHEQLGIPQDAIVFGRLGGFYEFDIPFVKEAVVELAQKHDNWFFLFMNTQPFCTLPNVLFLEKTWIYSTKECFINTCDAMLHARDRGETFGLACAEFSIRNKPVITHRSWEAAHLEILKEKALLYSSKEELIHHLEYCAAHREQIRAGDWDAYSKEYNPAAVMKQFNEIFILPLLD